MQHADPVLFAYVRTVLSIIVGLSVGRLLTGLARFIQHPKQHKVFFPHFAWVFFLLFYIINFWWWEFRLQFVNWTFTVYFFTAVYAGLLFLLCTLCFPDSMYEYTGFADYFMSRRGWFFGILIAVFLLDIIDGRIKGTGYLSSLGPFLWPRFAFYVAGSAAAITTSNARFHVAFAVAALVVEVVWAFVQYYTPV